MFSLLIIVFLYNSFAIASLPIMSQKENSLVYKFNQETSHGINTTYNTPIKVPSEFSHSLFFVFLQKKFRPKKDFFLISQILQNSIQVKTLYFPFLPHSQAPPLAQEIPDFF